MNYHFGRAELLARARASKRRRRETPSHPASARIPRAGRPALRGFDRRPAPWRVLLFWLASASLMAFGSCSEREEAEVVLHVSPTTTSAPSEIVLHKLHPTLGFESEGELARTVADLQGRPISHARKMFRGYLHWAESVERKRVAPGPDCEYVDIYPVAAPRDGRLRLTVRSGVIVGAEFHPTPHSQE